MTLHESRVTTPGSIALLAPPEASHLGRIRVGDRAPHTVGMPGAESPRPARLVEHRASRERRVQGDDRALRTVGKPYAGSSAAWRRRLSRSLFATLRPRWWRRTGYPEDSR